MKTPSQIHPSKALYRTDRPLPVIPVVEHYVGNEKFFKKAVELQVTEAFDITCDCEDGAAAGAEREHCEMLCNLISKHSFSKSKGRLGVRVHPSSHKDSKWEIQTFLKGVGKRLSYVTLPKGQNYSDLKSQVAQIDLLAKKLKLSLKVHILIETQGALEDVFKIAQLPRLETLDFGLMDFVSEHQGAIPASCMRSPGQFEHKLIVNAKTKIASAALANGVVPAHNVSIDLKDFTQARLDAARAYREYGYLRMWSIHPDQIQPIIRGFQAEKSDLEFGALLLKYAQSQNWGPVRYNGELYDRASYRYYWYQLERAKLQGVTLPEGARAFF